MVWHELGPSGFKDPRRPCPASLGDPRCRAGWLLVSRDWLLPDHLHVLAPAESLDVCGDDLLDLSQAFGVGCFGMQYQHARGCPHGALAPAEADRSAGFGPVDLLHLGARLRATAVSGRPVAHAMDLLGMPAELDEVPARVARRDVGFGGWHGIPFWVIPRGALEASGSGSYRDSMSIIG